MMLGGVVFAYILIVLLSDRCLSARADNLISLLIAITIINNAIIANIAYGYMDYCSKRSLSMGAEIVSRIHMMDIDTSIYPCYIVGNRANEVALDSYNYGDKIQILGGGLETDLLFDSDRTYLFLKNYFDDNIHRAEIYKQEQIPNSAIQEMGAWPSSDSVRLINGLIVIKLSNDW